MEDYIKIQIYNKKWRTNWVFSHQYYMIIWYKYVSTLKKTMWLTLIQFFCSLLRPFHYLGFSLPRLLNLGDFFTQETSSLKRLLHSREFFALEISSLLRLLFSWDFSIQRLLTLRYVFTQETSSLNKIFTQETFSRYKVFALETSSLKRLVQSQDIFHPKISS